MRSNARPMKQIRSLVELVPLSSVWTFERQADPLKLHRAHGTDRALLS